MAEFGNVVILTRTIMKDGVCVGAWDVNNDRMLRLLNEKGHKLSDEAPFQVGEAYKIKYATHYNITKPHTEDVAVYQYTYLDEVETKDFNDLIEFLCIQDLALEELFDGVLIWEGSAHMTPDNCTDYSVQIATLTCELTKSGEYYEQFIWGHPTKRIKYVGALPIDELPSCLPPGTPIRFSLARFWDRHKDGTYRAHLQLSAIY